MDVVTLLNLLFAAIMINFIYSLWDIKKYLSKFSVIEDYYSFEEFKSLARKHMYIALIQMILLITFNIVAIYGLLFSEFVTLIYILTFDLIIFLAGYYGKIIENRIMGIEVSEKVMKEEYDRICVSWKSKPFPDF